jgi:hypothetical protein
MGKMTQKQHLNFATPDFLTEQRAVSRLSEIAYPVFNGFSFAF